MQTGMESLSQPEQEELPPGKPEIVCEVGRIDTARDILLTRAGMNGISYVGDIPGVETFA